MSELEWRELADGAMASGREHAYLIVTPGPEDLAAGLIVTVRLTRWLRGVSDAPLRIAREALVNVIAVPLGRGPGRPAGEPELALAVSVLRRMAQGYEDGASLPGCPAWQQLALADSDAEVAADAAGQRAAFADHARRVAGQAAGARWGRPHIAPVETGAPWRSAAEADWDESRGD